MAVKKGVKPVSSDHLLENEKWSHQRGEVIQVVFRAMSTVKLNVQLSPYVQNYIVLTVPTRHLVLARYRVDAGQHLPGIEPAVNS